MRDHTAWVDPTLKSWGVRQDKIPMSQIMGRTRMFTRSLAVANHKFSAAVKVIWTVTPAKRYWGIKRSGPSNSTSRWSKATLVITIQALLMIRISSLAQELLTEVTVPWLEKTHLRWCLISQMALKSRLLSFLNQLSRTICRTLTFVQVNAKQKRRSKLIFIKRRV